MSSDPPRRVVTLGSSVAILVRGEPWEPWNHGRWFDVAPLSPDVVVLNYGVVDCQTPAVPHRLHRAVIDWLVADAAAPRTAPA